MAEKSRPLFTPEYQRTVYWPELATDTPNLGSEREGVEQITGFNSYQTELSLPTVSVPVG